MISAQLCPSLEQVQFASLSSDDTSHGAIVNVTCQTGFEFEDDIMYVAASCLDGAWWPDVSRMECTREFRLSSFVKLFTNT